jgi:hypothetical protein
LGIPFIGSRHQLPYKELIVLGIIRSLLMAGTFAICMKQMFGWVAEGVMVTELIVWVFPGTIAFFGFWWVTVKINQSLPPLPIVE